MGNNLTTWANNATSNPTLVTPVVKHAAQWSNDITKTATQYTPITKQTSAWNPEHALQTYFYDQDNVTYDSDLTDYNYLINGNTVNQRGQTAWRAS
jgi:hypothetical protein